MFDLDSVRKAVLHLAPVGLAALLALQHALDTSGGVAGPVPYWQALVAALTALAVWYPKELWAKALAGLAGALGSVVAAALTDGAITQAETLMIAVAFLAWATSAVAPNGPPAA
jgi:hypothetical protein